MTDIGSDEGHTRPQGLPYFEPAPASFFGPPPVVFGPVLLFQSRDKDNWTVRFLVLTKYIEGCCASLRVEWPKGSPTTTNATATSGVPFLTHFDVPAGELGLYHGHTQDVTFVLQQDASAIHYSVSVSGLEDADTELGPFTFFVPAAGVDAKACYMTCNDGWTWKKKEDASRYKGYEAVDRLFISGAATPADACHVMLCGGDQIYGDDAVFTHHDLWNREIMRTYYFREYFRRFGEKYMSKALATLPHNMQVDDHDYFEGYGSWTGKQKPPVQIGMEAQRARFVFQLGRDPAEALTFGPGDEVVFTNTSAVFRTGPTAVTVRLDLRSDRDISKGREIFASVLKTVEGATRAEIARSPDTTKHLVMLFAQPVVFSDYAFLDFAAKRINFIKTDIYEDAGNKFYADAIAQLVSAFQSIASAAKLRITYISGDVHVGGWGETRPPAGEKADSAHDVRFAQQWISSPFCNDVEEMYASTEKWVDIAGEGHFTMKTTDAKGTDLPTECVCRHLEAKRNFLVYDVLEDSTKAGSPKKLRGMLYFEQTKGHGDFAASEKDNPLLVSPMGYPLGLPPKEDGCCCTVS